MSEANKTVATIYFAKQDQEDQLHERLSAVGKADERSFNFMCMKAIRMFLDSVEEKPSTPSASKGKKSK
jgi:hypothetical protein